MKTVFFLLLLLNIALPLWQWRETEPEASSDSGLPPILLEHEYRTAQRGALIEDVYQRQLAVAEAIEIVRPGLGARDGSELPDVEGLLLANARPVIVTTVVPTPAVASQEQKEKQSLMTCYQIGPFVDQPSLALWLRNRDLKAASTLVRDVEEPLDFQVLYPAAKNPEQQRINKQMLNEKGIVDLWTIPVGDNKGAFSLGVYSDIQRANLFRKQLSEKGINAEVKQRFKTSQQYYAKLMLDKAQREQIVSAQGSMRLSACR